MRGILLTAVLALAACDSNVTRSALTPSAGTRSDDSPLRAAVEQNAATDEAVDRLGPRVIDEPIAPEARGVPNPRGAGDHPPPTAIGGGPKVEEQIYSTSSALNVLTSARCHRAKVCGGEAGCDGEAAADHGDELASCGKGVQAGSLSDCARQVRSTPCGSAVALPESCSAAMLCAPR